MPLVKYSAKFVRNLGNFESLHVEIGLEDSPRGEETVAAAFRRVKQFVEKQLLEDVDALDQEIKAIRGK